MRVSETMDLKLLAELMGKGTTQEEATVMRRFLLEDKINDTEDVSESVWPQMIRDAVELAEEQEVAMAEAISAGLGRSPEDWETMPAVEPDGGPTQADLRGEVDHV